MEQINKILNLQTKANKNHESITAGSCDLEYLEASSPLTKISKDTMSVISGFPQF